MKDIGLIAAMPSETDTLAAVLGKPLKTALYGDFCVKTHSVCGVNVHMINSGIGELCAAAATQLMISAIGAKLILNVGVCGGLAGVVRGEACLVGGVAHYDFDLSPCDGTPVGVHPDFGAAVVKTDEKTLVAAQKLFPSFKTVVCASGDKFVADKEIKNRLVASFGAQICEMESAGILFTAKRNRIPALIIKLVSDSDSHADEYRDFMDSGNADFGKIVSSVVSSKEILGLI